MKMNKYRLHISHLLDLPIAVAVAAAIYFAERFAKILVPLLVLLAVTLIVLVRYRKSFFDTVAISAISWGVNIFLMVISALISFFFNYLVYKFLPNESFQKIFILVILCCVQTFLLWILFRIKRFRSGIIPDMGDGTFDLLLLVSILCIFLMTLFYTNDAVNSPFELILLIIIFCGLTFFIWWRKHITTNYQKKIFRRNTDLLEQRLKSYEDEKDHLLKQNEELARIIHRDNKLIPAMTVAVEEIIAKYGRNEDLEDLRRQLGALTDEHKKLIGQYLEKNNPLPQTGSSSLDAVLHYLISVAQSKQVDCGFSIEKDAVALLIQSVGDPVDLNTLFCDLGENAVHSAKNRTEGKIRIEICREEDEAPSFTVSDNGPPFDEKVIAAMGRRKTTTRKKEGGNGIGLMTVFSLLRKYHASFYLNELPQGEPFTKSIKVTFDHSEKLVINSERNSIKKAYKNRSDNV